jgi:tetratricopeptide (TPR) repeat protein
MKAWAEQVQQLASAWQYREAERVLRDAAQDDAEAARDLGHLLLRMSWWDSQPANPGDPSAAERWLRQAVSAHPNDVQALTLLAALLASQCTQISDMIAGRRSAKRWAADIKRRAAQARESYTQALSLDPGSGAAASGLTWLLSQNWESPPPNTPGIAATAERALKINPDEPVAMRVLAEATGDNGLRERAEALSPAIPRARWRPAYQGGPVSPFGHGEPSRFNFFVIEVELLVSNSGETVPRQIVVGDADGVHWVSHRAKNVEIALVHRYKRGILAATHRLVPVSGKSLDEVIDEWPTTQDPGTDGKPLSAGHPIRHNGTSLHYGVNGTWMG